MFDKFLYFSRFFHHELITVNVFDYDANLSGASNHGHLLILYNNRDNGLTVRFPTKNSGNYIAVLTGNIIQRSARNPVIPMVTATAGSYQI